MPALAMNPERKRLDESAQTGLNQTQTPINPAFETRSRAHVAGQMPVSRYSGHKRLDGAQNSYKMQKKAFYLGNVGLNH